MIFLPLVNDVSLSFASNRGDDFGLKVPSGSVMYRRPALSRPRRYAGQRYSKHDNDTVLAAKDLSSYNTAIRLLIGNPPHASKGLTTPAPSYGPELPLVTKCRYPAGK